MFSHCEKVDEHLFELAALYIFQEKFAEAIKVYDQIEEVYGINEQVIFQKQKLYIQLDDLDGAIREGEKLIEAFPGESSYIVSLCEILISNGYPDKAVKYLEDYLIEFDDNDPNIKLLLAEVYSKKGEKDKANLYLKDAFSNPSLDLLTKLKVFNSYLQQLPNKDIEAVCLELSSVMIETHPDEPDVYAVAGDLYMELGENNKSIEMYRTAIDKGGSNYNVWHNLIRISFINEKYDDVIKYSENAIEYYPNQVFLYFFLGTAHLAEKHYDDAIEALEMGKSLAGKNYELKSTINSQLGDAYNFVSDFKKSDEAYEEALHKAHIPGLFLSLILAGSGILLAFLLARATTVRL